MQLILVLVVVGAVLSFIMGSVIGLVVVALVYRRGFLRGAIFGGVGFMLAVGVSNLGSIFGAYPALEFLREKQTPISLASSCAAAVFAGVGGRRGRTDDQSPA